MSERRRPGGHRKNGRRTPSDFRSHHDFRLYAEESMRAGKVPRSQFKIDGRSYRVKWRVGRIGSMKYMEGISRDGHIEFRYPIPSDTERLFYNGV